MPIRIMVHISSPLDNIIISSLRCLDLSKSHVIRDLDDREKMVIERSYYCDLGIGEMV